MSGIFGIIHLDGSPVTAVETEAMRSAMLEWGPDGNGLWMNGAAALGSLILFNTPEALREKLPLISPYGFVLTAEARLDNRLELFSQLGISLSDASSLPDGELILRAYEKWGSDTPHYLLGDWSFAAWHPGDKRLFIARDHSGNTSLYYYQDQKRFAFASSRKALLNLGIPRRLNEFYLACLLVSWPAHHGPQTIELDIHRLPPAHTLTLQANRLTTELYWRLEDTPQIHLKDSREYLNGFLSIYEHAIRDRMRSHRAVAATLSGGLDSGSITALMARALQEEKKRLSAYTSVTIHSVTGLFDEENFFADERPLAQATAHFAGNVDLIEIGSKQVTPIQGIRRGLEIHKEPGHAAGNLFWIYDMLAHARSQGVGTILSGQGGNVTVSWTGIDSWQKAWKNRDWKKAFQLIVFPLIPPSILQGYYRAAHTDRIRRWERTSIRPDFADRIDLASQYILSIGTVSQPKPWQPGRLIRCAVIKPGASFLGGLWAENSAAYGLELRDPTFDKRVLEFTLGIPDSEFMGPNKEDRWLMRQAMQGLLPDEVRLNRRRGIQAADLAYRLLDSALEVESTLLELEGSAFAQQYISMPRLRRVWEDIQKGVGPKNSRLAITTLTRGIMAGLYLVDFERNGGRS